VSIDQALDLLSRYGWPVMAIIGSPLLSWRVTQWFKLCFKRHYGTKPSTTLMDIGSFCIVLAATYWAWSIHSDNALFVSLCVACFHTAIVKAMFAYAPKKLSKALQYGSDNDSTIMTVFVGKDRRSKGRELVDEDKTQPR
jgi:hypothetical protein